MTRQAGFMRIALFVLGLCMPLVALVAQSKTDAAVLGSWLGSLDVAGAKWRLVFHIAELQDGTLTGTVDSPDKGIKGIPLSRVSVNGDSVNFEIAAASASYKGTLSNDKRTIEGVWKEGETAFPVVLRHTDEIIEPNAGHDNSKGNAASLPPQMTSQHFEFRALDKDRTVLDDVAKNLEANCARITDYLQTQFSGKIKVSVYPDIKSFHAAIFAPDAPEWVVGAGERDEIKIVSPLNPGTVHTYDSIMRGMIHEFVHAAVLNVRGEKGLVGMPKWLNEGYAFYEAQQMTDDMRRAVKSAALKGGHPTWSQLQKASTTEFGAMNGYAYSTTIVEFLVDAYGKESLRELIKAPENMYKIYGSPSRDLEANWIKYITKSASQN